MSAVESVGIGPVPRGRAMLVVLVGGLLFAAAALAWQGLAARLPVGEWWGALTRPGIDDAQAMLAHYTIFPRIAVALLAGAGLGLAGAVCQQVLRNPLAEPTTLGVAAGASLALVAATLWAPFLFAFGREWVALAGGLAAAFVVFGLAWSRALSPLSLVLAGLIVSLYCGAVGNALVLFNHDYLIGLFIWGAGSLTQQDWGTAAYLAPRVAIGLALILAMIRPLTLLGLDDETAVNLGLGLSVARLLSLFVAVWLSTSIVSAVGVLGFVGLAAPALATLAGARRFRDRLVWAPLCGAGLLWLTDQLVTLFPIGYHEVPTGAATALLGAPILLLLLPRLQNRTLLRTAGYAVSRRLARPMQLIGLGIVVLALAVWGTLAFGAGLDGWHWAGWGEIGSLLPWRAPRMAAAMAAGAMLAVAGVMMQRMTGNPMAAPEVLGVSSGAAMGVVALLFLVVAPARAMQIGAGGLGALAVLAALLLLGRWSAFSPDRLVLAGVATSAAFGAVIAIVMATGDPRVDTLIAWLAGSTYQVDATEAAFLCGVAILLLALAPMVARWLEILPLGAPAARSIGVSVGAGRLAIMVIAAVMTAAATLVVGPLSFVGLMAPHMARMAGLQRSFHHIFGAALIGAVLMLVADWTGRNAIFPFQVPAGLLATIIGGPYLMWLLRRQR